MEKRSRKATLFYIQADRIMNRVAWHRSWFGRIFYPCKIRQYMTALRWLEYYSSLPYKRNIVYFLFHLYYHIRYDRLGYQLGFEIPLYSLGYGCRIPHSGSIILNGATKIGNYCCLMNLTTFADGNYKEIGNHCFIGTGVVVAKAVKIADGCHLSACSFVNKIFDIPNQLIGGVPAKVIKSCPPWSEECKSDVILCEQLKEQMGIE